jgi:hypothetical protein
MTQEIRPNSARDIIERIFGDCPKSEQDYYEERLRTRYGDAKLRDKLPKACYRHESPPRPDEGILFNHHSEALTYWENLLHLDKLLKKPSEVFKVLDLAVQGQHANIRTIIKARRDELKLRLSPLEDLLEESAGWENIPDHFLPDEARLINLPASTTTPQQTVSSDAWKAKTIEKITHIEATDAWQSGDPAATAEKANLYIKIGAYALAHQQVEAGLVDHPEDPALHYVKACILLTEMNQNRWQAFTHQTLHQESAPLSGEEEHHAEQAFDQASIARHKEDSALIQLMSCYRYWDTYKLPNWAFNDSHHTYDHLLFKIIELADQCSLRIYEQHNWAKKKPKDVIESEDSPLSRDIIHFFTKGSFAELHQQILYFSDNFGTLIRYWSLMQRIKPLAYRNSVKQWRKNVDDSYEKKSNSMSAGEWFQLNTNEQIRTETSWSNPWPKLINAASSNSTFFGAMAIAKIPGTFFKKADKSLANQQADQRLWQRIVFEWRGLSRIQETQHHTKKVTLSEAVLKACKKARR